MLDQISILFLSVILFAVMMKKRYSLKVPVSYTHLTLPTTP